MTNKLEKPFHEKFGADITGMLFELADGEDDIPLARCRDLKEAAFIRALMTICGMPN